MFTPLLALVYVAFISLGLPDALLGAAWPVMQGDFGAPFGAAGLAAMIISGGTIVSSLLSGRVLARWGTGAVVTCSVFLTAASLACFAAAPGFGWLLAAALPLGLGAGAVDAALNAYVAARWESRHMSWLHCFWGVGALSGPLMLSFFLGAGKSWRFGYGASAALQACLAISLIFSLPLWGRAKPRAGVADGEAAASAIEQAESAAAGTGPESEAGMRASVLSLPGAKTALAGFLFYCGVETTLGLWGGSYLNRARGLDPASAATWVSLYYGSITLGRFLSGFVTLKVSNENLIRGGSVLALLGAALMALPLPPACAYAGFLLVGLGCAPIYPCMLHETPARFGEKRALELMGLQMAVAYTGMTLLPPFFGLASGLTGVASLPCFLLVYAAALLGSGEALRRLLGKRASAS